MLFASKPARFQLEISKNKQGLTSFAGLGLLRESLGHLGLLEQMKQLKIKESGYSDEVILEALILLLASGGSSLSDWERLVQEDGFQRIFGQCPSVDTLERYLKKLSIGYIEYDGPQGQIGYCRALEKLHQHLMNQAYEQAGSPSELTLDLDASIFVANKTDALFCYDNVKAYQPFIAYCPELGMILAYEFRDGNISPALGYRRLYEKCRRLFPNVKWTMRFDSAGYQLDFLDQVALNGDLFVGTVDQWKGLLEEAKKHEDWQPYIKPDGIQNSQEIAELSYISPSFSSQAKLEFRKNYRYLVIRKAKKQSEIFEEDFVYQFVVTNFGESDLSKLFHTHWRRCGSVEYAFSQLKSGCGMRRMPSGSFSVNAAWFSLGILTHNLLRVLQAHILPEKFRKLEIQSLRFHFLRSCAWVIRHARKTIIRFAGGSPVYQIYRKARDQLWQVFPNKALA